MMKRILGVALCLALATVCTFNLPVAAKSYQYLFGVAIEPSAADKSVVITNDTRHVNVVEGDAVRFLVGGKSFAWKFDGPYTIGVINLGDIAPAGLMDHTVKVYVSRNAVTDGR